MIFDTHAHYDDKVFDEDRKELLPGMKEHGIGTIVNVGADIKSCRRTLALAEEYSFIYGALGVHPSHTGELNEELYKWLKETCLAHSIINGGRIVAVGEIGLDYYRNDQYGFCREDQKKWFERQIAAAKEVKLPVIIHSREAAKDTYDIMKAMHADEYGGIVHCYSYSKELARDFLNMGFLFGIGGVVTFKNARKLKETVEYLPMENMVLETDSPYLSPVPERGKRNTSLNLHYIIEAVSEIKRMEKEAVIEITERNAINLFGLQKGTRSCQRWEIPQEP